MYWLARNQANLARKLEGVELTVKEVKYGLFWIALISLVAMKITEWFYHSVRQNKTKFIYIWALSLIVLLIGLTTVLVRSYIRQKKASRSTHPSTSQPKKDTKKLKIAGISLGAV